MIRTLRRTLFEGNAADRLIIAAALALAALLGQRASPSLLGLMVVGIAGIVFLARPVLGLPALVLVAVLLRIEIDTGSEVTLNPVTLLIPALVGLWLLTMVLRGKVTLVASPVNRPLLSFAAAGLLSLLVGMVLWDPVVPRGGSFLLVQLAQWAIIAFSAGTFLLTANLIREEEELRRLTFLFLLVGGSLAVTRLAPTVGGVILGFTTDAMSRAPFLVLLAGLAGGQLLFNRQLSHGWRVFLVAIIGVVVYYAFGLQREGASNWVGLTVTSAVLGWLRWPRLRWLFLGAMLALLISGFLYPALYNFAGGDEEWITSGGSRLALIWRVMEDTLNNNPITGLGPAAYRAYGATRPLQYEHIIWMLPRISSHNNYVDIFGHMGIVGLALFGWLVAAIARVGFGLRRRPLSDFSSGYVNGILAVLAGCLALMLLADWILPFVYNIGFPGFQASVLVWLFLGGLVAIEAISGVNAGADA